MASKIHTHRWNGEPQWETVANIYRKKEKQREKMNHWNTLSQAVFPPIASKESAFKHLLIKVGQRLFHQCSSHGQSAAIIHYSPSAVVTGEVNLSADKPSVFRLELVKPPLVHQQLCLIDPISWFGIHKTFAKCSSMFVCRQEGTWRKTHIEYHTWCCIFQHHIAFHFHIAALSGQKQSNVFSNDGNFNETI